MKKLVSHPAKFVAAAERIAKDAIADLPVALVRLEPRRAARLTLQLDRRREAHHAEFVEIALARRQIDLGARRGVVDPQGIG